MHFLLPSALIGLIAITIPIILHFLFRRNPQIIQFPTLRFIKLLKTHDIRRLKIRELILLLLRILIILFLALAFTRPAFQIANGNFSKNDGLVLIVLDDSGSMNGRINDSSQFENAKNIARELVRSLDSKQKISVTTLGLMADTNVVMDIVETTEAIRRIEQLKITNNHIEFSIGLAGLSVRDKKWTFPTKELFFITDLREETFQNVAENSLEEWVFHCVALSPISENVALQNFKNPTQIFQVGREIHPQIDVKNQGTQTVQQIPVQMWIDSIRAGVKMINLQPGESKTVDFFWRIKNTGLHTGYFQIPMDDISMDNIVYFAYSVPQDIHISVVSDDAEQSRFIISALRSKIGSQTMFVISDRILPTTEVAIVGAVNESQSTLKEIEKAAIPTLFWGSSLPQTTQIRLKDVVYSEVPLRVEFQQHEIFDGLMFGNARKINTPRISAWHNVNLVSAVKVLSTLENGLPFWVEWTEYDTQQMWINGTPNLSGGDFPLTGGFAPLMQRSVLYLAGNHQEISRSVVGEKLLVRNSTFTDMKWVLPSGAKSKISSIDKDFYPNDLGIHYFVGIQNYAEKKIPVVVSMHSDECGLDNLTSETRDKWKNIHAIQFYNATESTKSIIKEARLGKEIFMELLFVVLMLMFLEFYLSRGGQNER